MITYDPHIPDFMPAPAVDIGPVRFHWEQRRVAQRQLLFLVRDDTGEPHDVVSSEGMVGGGIVRWKDDQRRQASVAAARLGARTQIGKFHYRLHNNPGRNVSLYLGSDVDAHDPDGYLDFARRLLVSLR